MTKPKAIKVGQVYRCRDERHGKRWVRIERIESRRPCYGGWTSGYAHVSVRRGNSRKWVESDRFIKLSRFNDGKGDYKLVEK